MRTTAPEALVRRRPRGGATRDSGAAEQRVARGSGPAVTRRGHRAVALTGELRLVLRRPTLPHQILHTHVAIIVANSELLSGSHALILEIESI